MPKKIRKRNGRIVPYNKLKIIDAIYKATVAIHQQNHELAEKLADEVEKKLKEAFPMGSIPEIEQIQDVVEEILVKSGNEKLAKTYIVYREQHHKLREDEKILLDVERSMNEYLGGEDWRIKENANIGYSLGGLILGISGKVTANYWLNHIYPKEVGQVHTNGDAHIHDLSMFCAYCAGWSLRQLLEEGFNGIAGKIDSGPAKHLTSACAQMINFIGTLQNEYAGAQAFSSFDTYLAPFIRKSNLTYEEVKQAIQGFCFNMNIPSRWGTQTPFSNITIDWTCPDDMKDRHPIVGGKRMDFTYGELQPEMDMINKAYIEVMTEGDRSGRPFTFPIPTYNITRDFIWDSENADLLFAMTAKYGIPYFQNFINSSLKPTDVRSMCCRLQMDMRELKSKGGGLFGAVEMTGSIGVYTINLPRIGYLYKGDEKGFLDRLGYLMDIGKTQLEIKREVLNKQIENGLFPYTKRYLGNFDNYFSTIGINGAHEAMLNFLGQGIESSEGKKMCERILDFMRERMKSYQTETGHMYNLEATPAEGTSYRFAREDKKRFPDIIQSGTDETPYYTNSSQLPVNYTVDAFKALDHQDSLQSKYTGGTVLHAFLGEPIQDVETCKKLCKRIAENYHLPYFSITPTFSICPKHGYIPGEHEYCPKCDEELGIKQNRDEYYNLAI